MKDRLAIYRDDMGYYVANRTKRTLSTRDRKRAESWLTQANCHGLANHDKPCDQCKEPDQ